MPPQVSNGANVKLAFTWPALNSVSALWFSEERRHDLQVCAPGRENPVSAAMVKSETGAPGPIGNRLESD